MKKSIQDLLLAPIETGVIVLIGATTEHPAYELNNAIQSRTSVLILKPLETPSLEELLRRAEILMGKPLPVTAEARESLLAQAQGDGRFLINQAESLFAMELAEPLDIAGVSEALGARLPNGDKAREDHFDYVHRPEERRAGKEG